MKELLRDEFDNVEFSKQVWDTRKPWGNVSHKSVFTDWENVEFVDDGLRFFHKPMENPFKTVSTESGMIMMKNGLTGNKETDRPGFQYGRFTAEITVPYGTHCAFWLLSEVRYRQGIRTIMPEIDIAEFGTPTRQFQLNQAVHYWDANKSIVRVGDSDDYKFKNQRSKQTKWLDGRNSYAVDVDKLFTTFYINGKRTMRIFSRDSGAYMIPLFTHTHAEWQNENIIDDVILHNITIEQ